MPLVDDLLLTPNSEVRSMSDAAVKAAEALEKLNTYAEHRSICAINLTEIYRTKMGDKCTCGLDELRAQIFGETSDGE